MGAKLKDGDELLLKGSAGALFRVKVGAAFTAADVAGRLRTGEWSYPGDEPEGQDEAPDPGASQEPAVAQPQQEPGKAADPNRPGANDPKAAWITYVAGLKHMSLEDASAYTKADLIEMAS